MKSNEKSISKQIAFSAIFSALCCVSTLSLTVPLPASGYFNAGDVFVLLSGWFLGPLFGSLSAGIGSALADIISGYVVYAPVTFVVKFTVALSSYLLWKVFKPFIKKEPLDFIPRVLAGIIGETIMVAGYFAFESILYGVIGAVPNLLGNALQGVCCLVLATLLCSALRPIKVIRSYFPLLELNAVK